MAKVLARAARPQVDRCRRLNRSKTTQVQGHVIDQRRLGLSSIPLLLHTGTRN
jgi:hypothetical protein